MVLFETITREKLQPSKRLILNNMPEYHKDLNKEKTRVLNDVSSFYRMVMPVLCSVALCCVLFSLLRSLVQRVWITPLLIISLAALSGVLAITFILTLLTITSYDEITRALQVAYPLLVLFVITAFLDITLWWRQQPHAPVQQADGDPFL
ncbi:hypothetical protein DPPLL_18220 [Desulfofustis limnaeus]|uniref:Uncharacterized protein n=2 Tax=Desulfofustis limnaeus TaxID=2740163 RepID=A0ABN6M3G3_9BACT|nr:hypothetical protein DPPLL_18220 [Desulfofustis limnaeus]